MTRDVYAFESIDDSLPFVPLSARRVLEGLGQKLTLEGWLSLPLTARRAIVSAGVEGSASLAIREAIRAAHPHPVACAATTEPDSASPPRALLDLLGADRPLPVERWRGLRSLDRYSLVQCLAFPEVLAKAYDEIVVGAGLPDAPLLAHVSGEGHARMVDVASKAATPRRAVASARVQTTSAVLAAVMTNGLPKGDVLAVARVAGIMAAKKTPELVPLCHPVQTTHASVDFVVDDEVSTLKIVAVVEAVDRTGVEMEAMVAASVAALTVYDMIKSADRWARIEGVQLDEKSGGKSGTIRRPAGATS